MLEVFDDACVHGLSHGSCVGWEEEKLDMGQAKVRMSREVKNHSDFPVANSHRIVHLSHFSDLSSLRSDWHHTPLEGQDASETVGTLTPSITSSGNFSPSALATTKTVTRSLERLPPLHKSPRKDKILSGVIFQNCPVSSALKISLFWNSSLKRFSCVDSQLSAPP